MYFRRRMEYQQGPDGTVHPIPSLEYILRKLPDVRSRKGKSEYDPYRSYLKRCTESGRRGRCQHDRSRFFKQYETRKALLKRYLSKQQLQCLLDSYLKLSYSADRFLDRKYQLERALELFSFYCQFHCEFLAAPAEARDQYGEERFRNFVERWLPVHSTDYELRSGVERFQIAFEPFIERAVEHVRERRTRALEEELRRQAAEEAVAQKHEEAGRQREMEREIEEVRGSDFSEETKEDEIAHIRRRYGC